VHDSHRRLETHGTHFALHAPGEIAIFVGGVRKEPIKATYGDEGRAAIRHVAGEETPTIVISDRVFVQRRESR
jgi:hypothetical protein